MPFDLQRYESAGYGVVTDAVPAHLLAAMGAWLASAEAAARQGSAEEQARDLVFEKDLSDAGRNGIPATEVGDAIFILGDLCRYAPQFGACCNCRRWSTPARTPWATPSWPRIS